MRVTKNMLELRIKYLNDITDSPTEYSSHDYKAGEKFKANIGHYHLDSAYGGYKIVRTMNHGGGINEVTYGLVSKRECYDLLNMYIKGVQS